MPRVHRFGGDWTSDKLERIRKYLTAYMQIFKANPAARHFHTVYVDAFAGTGTRTHRGTPSDPSLSLFEADDQEHLDVLKGSALVALDLPKPFDEYLFIDVDPKHVAELESLRDSRGSQAERINIVRGDANAVLNQWCARTDWGRTRAVVFLDPYGMEVDWSTLERLAGTRAVDLWILFPLGQAVNRMLTRNKLPPDAWAAALDRFLGTQDWRESFYKESVEPTLFGDETTTTREADYRAVGRFFVSRLRSIFAGVAEEPLVLMNSKHVPIYLLCCAASNPKGAPIAIRIANHILKGKQA